MSLVKSYRDQFNIYIYDKDFGRSQNLAESLRQVGYKYATFSEEEALLAGVESQLPHMLVVFYQPLSLDFRQMIKKVRRVSDETEIVVLGSGEFWPGIKNLLDHGLVNDYWSWPMASRECLRLRIDQHVEKTIYRYIGEQKDEATEALIRKMDELQEMSQMTFDRPQSPSFDVYQLPGSVKSESRLIEDLINNLKLDYSDCEFAFLKFYKPKEQLLVYRTSFSADGYHRGQFFSYSQEDFLRDRKNTYAQLHSTLSELFVSEDYQLLPVEFSDDLYGFLIGFHVRKEDGPMLEKAVRYVALTMRNLQLEKTNHDPQPAEQFQKMVQGKSFYEALSREISRARRIHLPVSMILAHLDFKGDQAESLGKVEKFIGESLRVYDFYSRTAENEIAIILPHTDYKNAAIKAERLRLAVISEAMKTQNPPVRFCLGVAEFPGLAHGTDDLIEGAKAACDQVLASGKNKVCLYTQADDFEPEFRM